MLSFSLDSCRGAFHLQVECVFASDWTVIFGPSGAGKSTLLRLLAGLDRPINGRIALTTAHSLKLTADSTSRPAIAILRWSRNSQRSSLTSTLKPTSPTGFGILNAPPARAAWMKCWISLAQPTSPSAARRI